MKFLDECLIILDLGFCQKFQKPFIVCHQFEIPLLMMLISYTNSLFWLNCVSNLYSILTCYVTKSRLAPKFSEPHKALAGNENTFKILVYDKEVVVIIDRLKQAFFSATDAIVAQATLSAIFPLTVGSKIIRALVIILAIFLSFDCQFLSSHTCYKQYKA